MRPAIAAAILVGLWSLAGPARGQDEEPAAPPTAEMVAQWARQLGDGRYWVRRAATRRLIDSGAAAVGPVTEAAGAGNLEMTHRALDVLTELSLSDDEAVSQQALAALETLAQQRVTLAASRAARILYHQAELRQQRAVDQLQKLGAELRADPEFGSELTTVVLGASWTGGDEGVGLLRWLPTLQRLSVHTRKVGDAALPHLKRLKSLARLELYGASLSDAAVDELREALPGVEVDRRRGALLGISGSDHVNGCLVVLVQPGSAAAVAGLQPGDIITRFEDEAFQGFAGLTSLIARYEGGEKVRIVVQRGEETFTREVVLGRWK